MTQIAGILQVERRACPRLPVHVRVLYVVGGCVLEARTNDISEHGLCLKTEVDLEKGTEVFLYLSPDENAKTPRIEGEVIWTKAGESEGTHLCGVRFNVLPKQARMVVDELMQAQKDGAWDPHADIPEISPEDVVEVAEPSAEAESSQSSGPSMSDDLHQALQKDAAERTQSIAKAKALLESGRQKAANHDLDGALTDLEQALECMPDSEDTAEELARLLYLRGDVLRAASMFDRALNIKQEKG